MDLKDNSCSPTSIPTAKLSCCPNKDRYKGIKNILKGCDFDKKKKNITS